MKSGCVRKSRHSGLVRITHWLIALSVLGLVASGFGILISHPRLYWGETGGVGGGYNPGAYSGNSSSSYSSSSSAQDTADFNNFINSVNAIGTGYNSSCRSGNPYC